MTLDEMVRRVGEMLTAQGATLCTAESCTGGMIAGFITDVPGSSAYFLGGVVAYSNLAKERLLAVPHATLRQHGAVSAPVAIALARQARRAFGADVALSSTGIAGPGGGTPLKPVGLVYVALATSSCAVVRRAILPYDRSGNRHATVRLAFQLYLDHAAERTGIA